MHLQVKWIINTVFTAYATDNAGNVEEKSPVAEAFTTVTVGTNTVDCTEGGDASPSQSGYGQSNFANHRSASLYPIQKSKCLAVRVQKCMKPPPTCKAA